MDHGAKKKKERSPYEFVLIDGMHTQYTVVWGGSKLSRGRVDLEQVRKVIQSLVTLCVALEVKPIAQVMVRNYI